MEQGRLAFKILLHGLQERLFGNGAISIYISLHSGQGVRGSGQTGAVDAVVVINAALRKIPAIFQAALHHQGEEGGGIEIHGPDSGADPAGLPADLLADMGKQRRIVRGIHQMIRNGSAGGSGKRKGVDVDDLHPPLWNDELPAGGDGVIAGVFQGIAQGGEAGNDHIIVGILGKAQALAGQLGA